MIYKEALTDILADVVAELNNTVIEFTATFAAGVATLTVDDPLWAQVGRKITIEGYTAEAGDALVTIPSIIQEVTATTIKIKAADGSTITGVAVFQFTLYNPFFFHGTPIATGAELHKIDDAKDKTPMVWLLEGFSEKYFDDTGIQKERESSIRLFFLTQADHANWITQTAYEQAIEPMRRMMEHFVCKLKANKRFDISTRDKLVYNTTNYAKFGVYISEKGVATNKFADELSGVEMAATLTIKKKGCYC